MLVLGIAGFMHDYNCALIDVEGRRVAMAEAERLSRRKHHTVRPGDADLMAPVEKVCRDLGVRPRDIEVVAFGHTDPFPVKERLRAELRRAHVVEVDHHLCHAAGAFFSSPYERALVVSVDGFGDGSSALLAVGDGNAITELERVDDANSIGLEYLRATYHLGLGGYGAEGKTQGLAPYGHPTLYDAYMSGISVSPEGRIELAERMRGPKNELAREGGYLNTRLLTNAFLDDLGGRRIDPEPLTERHKDLAASVQKALEEVALRLCEAGRRRTRARNLVLSGGVSMNSSMNGRILKGGGFDGIFALPMASDRGVGLGAALHHVHQTMGKPRFFALDHVFYGGDIDRRGAIKAMKKARLRPFRADPVVDVAATALAEGRIVGWVQGRSEMGARALGHRSILADPRRAEMKDVINARVKHREWFRPFAPAVLAERAADYFDFPDGVADLSFMTFTVDATEKARREAPATVHVDGTARVQTVDRARDPVFAALIERFAALTGVPVLLNTSFNDQGEPIVETAADAVATFMKTDMDMLCIGDVVATKA